MNYLKKENNYLYQVKSRTGRSIKKLLGMKCPHCGWFMPANSSYKGWEADGEAHIKNCTEKV